jgi:AAA15 family ATPase/GTPase
MLLQFSVENFLSFKDKVVISLSAGRETAHEENAAKAGKYNVLRSVSMYGANASGKTNLIKAFSTAIFMLRQSNNLQINFPLTWIVPFKMNPETVSRPSVFEFIFFANNIKYVYGFSATITAVIDEYLYAHKTTRPCKIFERTNTHDYSFPASDKEQLEALKERNSPNKLFLATATAWNFEKTRDAYLWFAESIDTFGRDSWNRLNLENYLTDESGALKRFTREMLLHADINIDDYRVEEKEIPTEQINALSEALQMDPVARELLKNDAVPLPTKAYSFTLTHTVKSSDGDGHAYSLDISEESDGTRRLLAMIPYIKSAFEKGTTIVVDEIESSLHPLLVEAIIRMFHNPKLNTGNAQLIFSTHNVNLMNLDIFRRDQIYFLEKNPESAATEIYALDEFSVKQNKAEAEAEDIRKEYLQGRYGAVPFVSGEYDNANI